MRHFLSLFILPVLFCTHSLTANPLPTDPSMIAHAPTPGVELYVKPHRLADEWLSLKVIFKYAPGEHALFSLDLSDEDWGQVHDFLAACAQSAKSGNYTHLKTLYPASFASLLHAREPSKIGIIAVGEDISDELQEMIQDYFSTQNLPIDLETHELSFSDELEPSQMAISLALDFHTPQIQTEEDLKNCWKSLIVQELLARRLEECTKKLGELWVHPHPQGFFPSGGFALLSENDAQNVLGFFFWQLDRLKVPESFEHKKEELLRYLCYLEAEHATLSNEALAACYADLFLIGAANLQIEPFLQKSLSAIQAIKLDELAGANNPRSHLVYAKETKLPLISTDEVEEIKQELEALALGMSYEAEAEEESLLTEQCANSFGSSYFALAQNISPSFSNLPLSSKDKDYIDSIITTMANNNIFQLAFHKSSLEKKGKKIDGVHPLRFMGYILSNRALKECLKTIKKSSFKWDALIDGFSRKMREQLRKDNVYQHIDGFAATVGGSKDKINAYISSGDFEGLVKSLM